MAGFIAIPLMAYVPACKTNYYVGQCGQPTKPARWMTWGSSTSLVVEIQSTTLVTHSPFVLTRGNLALALN